MKEMTVQDIFNTLSEDEKQDVYYIVGWAIEHGGESARALQDYKNLKKSLDDGQMKMVERLIDIAGNGR